MEQNQQPKKFSGAKTKALIPVLKKFNAVADTFIRTLSARIGRKEKEIARIAVMVKDIKIPDRTFNISVQTMDMGNIMVKRKEGGSFKQKMDWDKDYRAPKKGVVL